MGLCGTRFQQISHFHPMINLYLLRLILGGNIHCFGNIFPIHASVSFTYEAACSKKNGFLHLSGSRLRLPAIIAFLKPG
ncbi:MAG: hypothetical protein JWR26_3197 [Pedosphaera sp.]|nr:hypothetical protein [Pedosphaera sp.]